MFSSTLSCSTLKKNIQPSNESGLSTAPGPPKRSTYFLKPLRRSKQPCSSSLKHVHSANLQQISCITSLSTLPLSEACNHCMPSPLPFLPPTLDHALTSCQLDLLPPFRGDFYFSGGRASTAPLLLPHGSCIYFM
jgi:hypothetical protein